MSHTIIEVSTTHHGPLPPGILIVVPNEKVSSARPDGIIERGQMISFENPVVGGFSFGTARHFVKMPTCG